MSRRLTTADFIERSIAVHGDRYDYGRVEYKNGTTKVEIVCPDHGPFWQQPNNHVLRKTGCPACKKCRPTTHEDFLARSREHHGDRYDYSRVRYHGVDNKVEIVCPDHGPFWQVADSHMRGRGCVQCGAIKCVESARWSTSDFIAHARAAHGDRYDYGRTLYRTSNERIVITCTEHGDFEQVASHHLAGNGCPTCGGVARVDADDFLRRSVAVHGDRYDYSRVRYRGRLEPVEIICSDHGPFWQVAKYHMDGSACPACAGTQPVSLTGFIARAQAVHGDRYDYSRVKLTNTSSPVEIVCREHGVFEQRPTDHVHQGQGCPDCAGKRPVDANRFLQRARAIHGDAYLYKLDSYRGLKHQVDIICQAHGVFSQLASNHIKGSGCPKCAGRVSRSEQELADWVEALGFAVQRNDRAVLDGLEIDIYIPEKSVGIEYNGSWWHAHGEQRHPRRHERKADAADRAGIRLITVWDFDWEERTELVKRHLRHALGCSEDSAMHARKCQLLRVDNDAANALYDRHHIQGGVRRQMVNYALLDDRDQLVACMSFLQGGSRRGRFGSDEWELIRFATTGMVRGGAGRLFRAFVRNHCPQRVWSFSDRQHFSGNLYPALGFERDGNLAGNYRVIHKRTLQRWNKAAWQRRHIPARLAELGLDESFDPATDLRTEREMQELAGVVRIMDAGKVRWRWDAPAGK